MASTKAIPTHSGPPSSAGGGGGGGGKSSGQGTNDTGSAVTQTSSSNSIPPSPTLYLTNLPEKLRKEDLRTSLYTLFSTYGVVLDVVAMRGPGGRMRGQAHVAMRDTAASTQALRALQEFDFFGRPMRIRYSDNKAGRSHVFNRLEGRWLDKHESKAGAEDGDKKVSAFEAPRPGDTTNVKTEADKSGPGLADKKDAKPEGQGIKRPREEEDDGDDEEQEMEEESDVEMEESDED